MKNLIDNMKVAIANEEDEDFKKFTRLKIDAMINEFKLLMMDCKTDLNN